MKTWRFSVSDIFFGSNHSEKSFELFTDAGYSGIEGCERTVTGQSDQELEALRNRSLEFSLPFVSYHLAFSSEIDLASFYEEKRIRSVQTIISSIKRAKRIGAHTGILHPGQTYSDVEADGAGRYRDQFSRSLETIVPVAEELNFRIAVENLMSPSHRCYFSLPEHILEIRRRFEHELIGFCLDTGHSLIASSQERQLDVMDAMGDRIFAFHLQDTPGDRDIHIAPGRGKVDFAGTFKRIKLLGIDEILCIETPPFAPGRPFTLADWKKLIEDTRLFATEG